MAAQALLLLLLMLQLLLPPACHHRCPLLLLPLRHTVSCPPLPPTLPPSQVAELCEAASKEVAAGQGVQIANFLCNGNYAGALPPASRQEWQGTTAGLALSSSHWSECGASSGARQRRHQPQAGPQR